MAHEEHIDEPEDHEDNSGEIDEEERHALEQDLVDVKTLKAVLRSRGIKGVVVYCPDCEDDHFLDWDLLADNLQQILETGQPPVHEPAWEPDPDEYVTWDYALGFLDGFESRGGERGGEESCGYCGTALPDEGRGWAYCPACGKELAAINLIYELRRQGWSAERIAELLDRAGFDRPSIDIDEIEVPESPPGSEGADPPPGTPSSP
ncbi:MAG: DUF5319 family protein [Actinomycetota bacterium]